MTTVTVDIKDDKDLPVLKEILNRVGLNYKVSQKPVATPLTNYKAEVLEGIKETMEEVKLIKKRKLKGIPAKELLNEP